MFDRNIVNTVDSITVISDGICSDVTVKITGTNCTIVKRNMCNTDLYDMSDRGSVPEAKRTP